MFKILGLSLAGWNALMSFVMFSIVSVFLMKKGLSDFHGIDSDNDSSLYIE